MSAVEIIAFALGGTSVALAVRERVLNFPVGMAMSVAFGFLSCRPSCTRTSRCRSSTCWGRVGLAGMATRRRRAARHPASPRLLAAVGVAVVVITAALYPLLHAVDDPAPFLDSLTTAMSLAAQALLNLKRLETWYLWIAVDLIYVPFYASQDLWLTAVVYVGFLGLCVLGIRHWRRA